ncbi:MAG: hypothetical protein KGQ79_03505 [Proteobacteria bacterium]|nr:hypothetical protein [Pseudomonadota bacterium]
MPKRREPSDDEISALAKELHGLWRRSEALRPWLRKHRQMILDLVHDDWSWAAMAKVFCKAGIKYKAGKGQDWHAEGLRREFVRAAIPLKRDKNPENVTDKRGKAPINTSGGEAERAVPDATDSPPTVTPHTTSYARDRFGMSDAQAFPAAPVFKAFSLKRQEPPPELSPAAIEERDVVRRRIFGK